MKSPVVLRLIPAALAVLGAVLIGHWIFSSTTPLDIPRRIPEEDKSALATGPAVDLKGELQAGQGKPGDLKGSWPCFRGSRLDNIATDATPLARQFAGSGPAKLWEVTTGEGYAGAAVADGRVYFLDYDEKARADVLRCLSTTDGKEIWRRGYLIDIGRNHGISRTVCAVADGCVITLGPKCHVMCVDAATGAFKWGIDLVKDYKSTVPPWYAGQNPLIDQGRVILAPAGESLLIAVELATGKLLWKTPNPKKWEMTHSSVVPVTIGTKKIYLYCASAGLAGVSADDGSILFELPQWKVSMANVPTPLPLPDNRVLLTGGYGAGAMMIRLEESGGSVVPKILFRLPPEVFGAEQQTPIFYKGYIYGVIPVSAQLVCLNLDGKQVWASGGKNRFGLGPYMIADGVILLVNDTGTLTLAEASEAGFKLIAQGKLFDHGHEAWGPLGLAGGRLLARDMTRLACFDLRKVAP